MLTYHQVQGYLQKSVALSNDLRKVKELLLPVLQIFESIERHNQELGIETDTLHREIRAVELLGEILRQKVYHQPGECQSENPVHETGVRLDASLSSTMDTSVNWSVGGSDYVV